MHQENIISVENLAFARGCIDVFDHNGEYLTISGWLFHPDYPIDEVCVVLNGKELGTSQISNRHDVKSLFSHLDHSLYSGFTIAVPSDAVDDKANITVIGILNHTPQIILEWFRRTDLNVQFPLDELMFRVAGTTDKKAFTHTGFNAAMQMMHVIEKFEIYNERSVLEWGCGCGRVASHILQNWPGISFTGCDIDSEAIEWCNNNLAHGKFNRIDPYPPTSFPDASFSSVIACSVMTHLCREDQILWLTEIGRLLKPKGIFAVSLHGVFAASFFPGLKEKLLQLLIIDNIKDPTLDGIAPEGYYRAVFQTHEYTARAWSRDFDIKAYYPGGLVGFQDLLVLQKK